MLHQKRLENQKNAEEADLIKRKSDDAQKNETDEEQSDEENNYNNMQTNDNEQQNGDDQSEHESSSSSEEEDDQSDEEQDEEEEIRAISELNIDEDAALAKHSKVAPNCLLRTDKSSSDLNILDKHIEKTLDILWNYATYQRKAA